MKLRSITTQKAPDSVRRFPYAVLYSIRPGWIRVLAVMNRKRRPTYWVGRDSSRLPTD